MNGSRTKILLFLVGILLLANIVMLVFFVGKKSPEKPPASHYGGRSRSEVMRELLRDSVGFSQQQLAQFDQLRQTHRESVKQLFDEMRIAKLGFYKLTAPADSAALSTAAEAIAQKQKQLDLTFFKHFQDVRQLCTPDQTARYDSLVQKIVRRMVSGRGEPRQKKDDKEVKK